MFLFWRESYNIVACHLPRGSELRWREDMGGGLPNNTQYIRLIKTDWYKYTAWRWGEPTYIYNLYLSPRFVTISWDMNFGPVWFLVEWHPDRQTDRQTDRKWCIRAHRAIGTGGLKNSMRVGRDNILQILQYVTPDLGTFLKWCFFSWRFLQFLKQSEETERRLKTPESFSNFLLLK